MGHGAISPLSFHSCRRNPPWWRHRPRQQLDLRNNSPIIGVYPTPSKACRPEGDHATDAVRERERGRPSGRAARNPNSRGGIAVEGSQLPVSEELSSLLCLPRFRTLIVVLVKNLPRDVGPVFDRPLWDILAQESSDSPPPNVVGHRRRWTLVPVVALAPLTVGNVLPVGTLIRVVAGKLREVDPGPQSSGSRPWSSVARSRFISQ